ncbi:hypothetical protein M422DRAFT_34299 [Sphaerobolus stellatus SS14]|uniref:4-coumarate--CoA ligase n=1 Tax=Sphaerobolus stellatus (strain SS14) TaxID=990650 RepID=A0A0C9VG21_SPHS4|nr:hypothetical protein M422DRAFT_34299 [Sphaerobolus stellatus SS14]
MPRIYRSTNPYIPIPERSIFTQVFSNNYDSSLPAYIDAPTGFTLTRGDVRKLSLEFGWGLRNILGQRRGDIMAIFSPNSVQWPIALLGGIAAGMRITTVNSSYTPPELLHQLQDSGAYYVFTHPALVGNAHAILKLMKVSDAEIRKRIILVGPATLMADPKLKGLKRYDELLGKGQLQKVENFDGSLSHETVMICYSSGTTSKSKGVELTHKNVNSVIVMVEPRFNMNLRPNHSDCMLSVLPFFHIYGLTTLVLLPFFLGAPQVVMSQFNPEDFCAYVQKYKITCALIVPPILIVLANHPAPENYDMRSLRILFSGAAPLGEGLTSKVDARLKKLGVDCNFPQGWGLTETSPTCIMQDTYDWIDKPGTIGTLVSNVQARLVLDDETDAPEGEPGEIWIKGPNVMKGYLNNPEATRDAITPDGWFKTGDVAIVDKDNFFQIVDRKKELIKYKGFQVPPADLEAVLLTHPDVLDAGVIGVHSEVEATELPRAYVVPRGGVAAFKTVAEKDAFSHAIQSWIQTRVAKHKYLRGGVVLIDTIPKSAAGKILRKDLRELAKREHHVSGAAKAKL